MMRSLYKLTRPLLFQMEPESYRVYLAEFEREPQETEDIVPEADAAEETP